MQLLFEDVRVGSVDSMADLLLAGDRRTLARAITLVESIRPDHRQQSEQLLSQISAATGNSVRIGISGTPGVGKSTFIESFGLTLIEMGRRVAVLTVDPSSSVSGGSILGDKTRMEKLSRQSDAYVRSSPSGLTLGGVARRTREAVLLCEAAGFDVVVIETVGVGQSEVAVSRMTDTFMLLLQPAAGDDLQGIKRGIMELAEIVVVNKADGELKAAAIRTAADYQNAIGLLHGHRQTWQVPVRTCSGLTGDGVDELWLLVQQHQQLMLDSGQWIERRQQQAEEWFWTETHELLVERMRKSPLLDKQLMQALDQVREQNVPSVVAARSVIDGYFSN